MGTEPSGENVTIEREFAHPVDKVWRALTQQWLLSEWLMANDFAPEVGRSFTFTTAAMPHWDGVVRGQVIEVEEPSRLAYSWDTQAPDGGVGLRTIVRFTLKPDGAGTLLRIEQTGFRADQPENQRGAQFGWGRNLDALDAVLEKLT